jgi:hypothetical protein
MKKTLLILLTVFFLAGCGSQQAVVQVEQSGTNLTEKITGDSLVFKSIGDELAGEITIENIYLPLDQHSAKGMIEKILEENGLFLIGEIENNKGEWQGNFSDDECEKIKDQFPCGGRIIINENNLEYAIYSIG